MSIFIIEDSHIDASLMREMLQTEGVSDIRLFSTGEAAMAALAETGHSPKLFVVDIRLPGMSGVEFVSTMKRSLDSAPIPAVCISTSALDDDINSAYAAGASAYFVKPSNIDAYKLIASAIHLMWFDARIARPVGRPN